MHNVVTTVTGNIVRAICAIPEPRQKQIERQIEMIIARSGGRFTDSVEREVLQVLDGYPPFGAKPITAFE
jgi:hypothetical protein